MTDHPVMNAFEMAAADLASRGTRPRKPANEDKALTVPALCEFLATGPKTSNEVARHFGVLITQASAMLGHLLHVKRATAARVWDTQAERKVTRYTGCGTAEGVAL